jgi:PKD repeat protein
MMSQYQSVRRSLLSALAGGLLIAGVASASAQADSYGEVARFPISSGGFALSETTNAFGIDQSDNNLFVGLEKQVGGEETGEYEIFEFPESGNKGSATATTAVLKPKRGDGFEGIAVDSVTHRIYALGLYLRETAKIDNEEPAAGTVYAFEEQAGKLISAVPSNPAGELMGPEALKAHQTPKEEEEHGTAALLNPTGITVDSKTDEVIILGEVDHGAAGRHMALQKIRINANGEGELGQQYVDPNETEPEEFNSPVILPDGAIYVQSDDFPSASLNEIPASFDSSTAPTTAFDLNTEESVGPFENRLEFDVSPDPIVAGAALSLAPGPGSGGMVYSDAEVQEQSFHEDEVVNEGPFQGVLAVNYEEGAGAKFSEHGTTGGQSETADGAKGKCVIAENEAATYPLLAAGENEKLFVLSSATLEVIEFGKGGTGCPHASVPTTPPITASVSGKVLQEGESISAGTEVTLGSVVLQGNALSAEWSLEPGKPAVTTKPEGKDFYEQTTGVTHTFAEEGTFKVVEKIHTDNLATPELTVERTIVVKAAAPKVTSVITKGATVNQPVELQVNAAGNGAPITAYHWKFGDGSAEETTTAAKTFHTYTAAGKYTVEVTATNKVGTSEAGKGNLTVAAESSSPPPTTTTTTSSSTPSSSTESAPPPSGGVLGVNNSAPPPVPDATIASTSLSVSSSGAVAIKISCPAGESVCSGTVVLRTLSAVASAASSKKKKKKSKAAILTLASGSFSVAGGQSKTITLHLSSSARALLAHSHTLKARATVVAHDLAGASHTTQATVTLRAAKPKHHD